MTTCPKCQQPHRGPRATELLYDQGLRVMMVAHRMPIGQAGEYLRSQWMGGALELSGWCSSCTFAEIAATSPGAKKGELDQVAQVVVSQTPTAALAEAEYGEAPLHVCKVIPMPRPRERVARDLLDIGSPKPRSTP